MKIGYWEAWNSERPCLHMKASQINILKYTHLYFAFASITPAFKVSVGNLTGPFTDFKALNNRFIRRVVFLNKLRYFSDFPSSLDGVDFDWEYPIAPDIPGISLGSPEDGPNYLAFLKLVKAVLLDFGNAWSNDGRQADNCLRSHVNITETKGAMAIITHAGVQASKVIVGIALYKRSFKMTTPGCYGQDCTYTSKESGATPGRCTGIADYISNFEIRDIIENAAGVQQYANDEGDILVYNSV
ncbi:glycoside hydrolase superfamily [Leptodontidium sp. 2 PMI_412]|nr:glycoside hydrolase superfamily [Leptodontidium sp. 2 PMI_412]